MSQDAPLRVGSVPWFSAHPRAAVVVASGLFLAVTALRFGAHSSGDAVTVLYSLPVALLAVAFGRRGGLIGATVGYALFALFATWHANGDIDALGWIARGAALFLLGGLLGHAADQSTTHARLALAEQQRRLALEESERRQLEALEINDTVIQAIAAAKWLVERGETTEAVEILAATIATGQRLVAGLLPRSITRLRPTGTEPGAARVEGSGLGADGHGH